MTALIKCNGCGKLIQPPASHMVYPHGYDPCSCPACNADAERNSGGPGKIVNHIRPDMLGTDLVHKPA